VSVYGALTGPLIGYFFVWLLQPPELVRTPLSPAAFIGWLLWAARSGIEYVFIYYSILNLAIDYVCRRYRPRGLSLGAVYLCAWLSAVFLSLLISPGGQRLGLRDIAQGTTVRIIVVVTVFFAILRNVRLKLERARAQRAAAEATSQVKALQAQINPHFFFNTLNTIYALIEVDPQAAQRTVALLADMSRYAFATAQSDLIPLAQELDFANAYLEIEKIRFGRRLQCAMPDASMADGIRVPALIVQPLIENAIRHGISKRLDGGNLSVEIDRDGARFSLTVKNECDVSAGRSPNAFFREGHALENIRQRLRLLYQDEAFLTVSFPDPDAISVTLTGPASNGMEALRWISDSAPDVVFLDIEMPELSSFDVLAQLRHAPLVVFATAYDEYAVRAFEANAIDYVLKPVQPARLEQTVGKIRKTLEKSPKEYEALLRRALSQFRPGPPAKLAARRGKRIVLLSPKEILYGRIEDEIVFLHSQTERFATDRTIAELEELLADAGFFRISRSAIVNLAYARELLPWSSGTCKLKLSNNTELDVSRERARELKSRIA
jgi:DNA-binding LytR/AlgR family response regulator